MRPDATRPPRSDWRRIGPLLPLSLAGCGTLVGGAVDPPPNSVSPPRSRPPVEAPALSPEKGEEATSTRVVPLSPTGSLDPILDSPWARTPEMQEDVQFWLESLQTREAERLRRSLRAMGRYRNMVEAELAVRRLPRSLVFLPIVESWYNPRAVSWVGAGGLWQFMAPTARGMGMKVDRLVDERLDPYRATPLALDFLRELHQRFDSWFLALAAYNAGPNRVSRLLRRRAPEEEGHDGLFMAVQRDLPRETRNFIPRFLAVSLIASDPEAYGFGDALPDEPLAFDEVEVPDATSLDVVADAAGVELDRVEALNPQLRRGLTPAGIRTRLRIPAGTGARFAAAYAQIPREERVTFLEHVVASGETLTHIAHDYGVSVADLRAANPRIEPRRMQIGQRVVVPKAPSARQALRSGGSIPGVGGAPSVTYRVRWGDTLSAIAARHGVRVGDLLRWNGLTLETIIRPGDELTIHDSGGGS